MLRRILAFVFVLCLPAMVLGQALIDHVPADAFVYAGWAGPANIPGYQDSHLQAVLGASDIHQFFSQNFPQLLGHALRGKPGLAEKVQMIWGLEVQYLSHPAALYVTPTEAAKPGQAPVAVTLLCDAGNDSAKLLQSLKQFIDKLGLPPGAPIQAEMQGDLVVLTIGQPDTTRGSLAQAPAFQSVMQHVEADPAAAVYVNVDALVKVLDAAEMHTTEQAKWQKAKAALGLTGIHAFAWSGKFAHRNWVTQAFLDAPEPRSGLLAGMSGPVSDQTLKLIPQSATTAVACKFNLSRFVENLRNAIAQIDPAAGQKFDQTLAMGKVMIGADIKTDLIDSLGDQWAYFVSPQVAGNGAMGMVLLNKLTDAAKEQHALESVEQAINNFLAGEFHGPGHHLNIRFRTTKYNGLEIHYLDTPFISPSWTIDHGILYAGLYPQVIVGAQSLVSAGGPSILDNPKFSLLRLALGGEQASGICFADCQASFDNAYPTWMVISRYVALADIVEGVTTPPPFVLPPFQAIKTQLTPAMRVGWWDKTGWHSRSDSAFPGAVVLSNPTTLIGVGTTAFVAGVIIPARRRSEVVAREIKCASNMRVLGLAMQTYANDHHGQYPPDLGSLASIAGVTPQMFICPEVSTPAPEHSKPAELTQWVNQHTTYIYLGNDKLTSVAPSEIIMYQMPNGRFGDRALILYADGHIDSKTVAEATKLIEKQTGHPPK